MSTSDRQLIDIMRIVIFILSSWSADQQRGVTNLTSWQSVSIDGTVSMQARGTG